ncbi:MAG TPA: glycosyltransferase family 4 protein [Methylomirabilota bacterium]|nr:glycosyltransferase family 4 protein [Methylomirabilota bacterium]
MAFKTTPRLSETRQAASGGRLRIAQVAPLFERVPPIGYGGTERVVAFLCEALVRRGHAVTLYASGDSSTAATLVPVTERALRLDPDAGDPIPPHLLEIARVIDQAEEFDIIHSHLDALAFPFSRVLQTPTIHTLHGRLDLPYMRPVYRYFRDIPLISISDAQREPLRALNMNWTCTVHHGLPVAEIPFSRDGGRYLAFLGRIAPEKRPDLAIAVATRAGIPLKIAAKIDPVDRAYFERDIRPLLGHPLVEFVGEVNDAERAHFLGGALALLFPIDWPEPFGLVMIEALACGTPVVARPRGSVRELITPERTGLLGESVDDLVAAVKRVDRLDRRTCRREVEERFSLERMVSDYEAAFARLLMQRQIA